ncbi:MAG: UDP-N-acetylglucosamine 1-carboxyvinyltransferase [Anaerolineae bacterium]|nr:UDP-N-acetylglucosamine 1-carboxyvinyltransferase [Anaerolineae bacterium]MDW8298718.1 UDP-N-acetylglucosamine 1-carboxyvinyltransferase [Anaerolineae bacterium]
MQQFIIEGGYPLNGVLEVGGNKNAVLKLMAACLLTDQPVTLTNVPSILDVRVMAEILRKLGASVAYDESARRMTIHAERLHTHVVDASLSTRLRASIVLAGALLGRLGAAVLPFPGGDVIGRRRVDTHLLALQKLGAQIEVARGFHMRAEQLRGANVLLDEASVTATENAILAAARAKGTTVIRNAACEPHVQDLCHFLVMLGVPIEGIGSNQIVVHGREQLGGGTFRVGADYIEVASYIGAAAVTGGEVLIKNADPQHLAMIELVYNKLGVHWEVRGEDIFVPRGQAMRVQNDLGNRIPTIKAQPWPAFPSDLLSIALVIATQSSGAVMFHEWMYDGRLFFTDKLVSMGARIVLCDPHRALVQGHTPLHGNLTISSPDIRAGIALLIAALCARGTTIIGNAHHIDRGYERVEEKLSALGAKIERVTTS